MSTLDFTAAVWRKSTRSGGNGGQCVEVTVLDAAVGVRDSKNQGRGPNLTFIAAGWTAFTQAVKADQFS